MYGGFGVPVNLERGEWKARIVFGGSPGSVRDWFRDVAETDVLMPVKVLLTTTTSRASYLGNSVRSYQDKREQVV